MCSSRTDLDVIRCIFYSEFHPTAGPMLVYQVQLIRRISRSLRFHSGSHNASISAGVPVLFQMRYGQ